MDSSIIVSERERPIWQIIIAAVCFTLALSIILAFIIHFFVYNPFILKLATKIHLSLYCILLGLTFCTQKRIHIDIKNSKFKPTTEIGNFKFGSWKTIHNYEYVSVFQQLLSDGSTTFEVNIWYDTNKHFQLYERNSFEDAITVGYYLSEELNIDLLDATIPNDFKWIDKEEWKLKIANNAS